MTRFERCGSGSPIIWPTTVGMTLSQHAEFVLEPAALDRLSTYGGFLPPLVNFCPRFVSAAVGAAGLPRIPEIHENDCDTGRQPL
jgi:hypothetical protein